MWRWNVNWMSPWSVCLGQWLTAWTCDWLKACCHVPACPMTVFIWKSVGCSCCLPMHFCHCDTRGRESWRQKYVKKNLSEKKYSRSFYCTLLCQHGQSTIFTWSALLIHIKHPISTNWHVSKTTCCCKWETDDSNQTAPSSRCGKTTARGPETAHEDFLFWPAEFFENCISSQQKIK